MNHEQLPQNFIDKRYPYSIPKVVLVRLLISGTLALAWPFAMKSVEMDRSVIGLSSVFAVLAIPLILFSVVALAKELVNPGLLQLGRDTVSASFLFGTKYVGCHEIASIKEIAPKVKASSTGRTLMLVGRNGKTLLVIGQQMLPDGETCDAVKKFLNTVTARN